MNNVLEFEKMKKEGQKISMITAYDYSMARIAAESRIDCILVGDSVSMVVHGFPTTLSATTEMMATHTRAVAKGAPNKFIVGDMPFLSFRKGIGPALDCVHELMSAGAHAVKLEGVYGHEDVIRQIVESGVPVMGHLGLTPQSIHRFGGFKVQGKNKEAANDLIIQAEKLQQLGCFAVVLECIPSYVAQEITSVLRIPTIGIGAGPAVDGQVLVWHDLLGLDNRFKPKFLKRYLESEQPIVEALNRYDQEVKERVFPTEEESYT